MQRLNFDPEDDVPRWFDQIIKLAPRFRGLVSENESFNNLAGVMIVIVLEAQCSSAQTSPAQEALASLEVFQMLAQKLMQRECTVVRSASQLMAYRPWAYYLVVLLSKGILHDPGADASKPDSLCVLSHSIECHKLCDRC